MSNELTHEQLRELGKRLRAQLPDGLCYCVLIWPPADPSDVAYFSNAHQPFALVAMQSLAATLSPQAKPA